MRSGSKRVKGFESSFILTLQRAKQELEEIYCDQTQTQFSLDDLGINSPKSKFALQTGYQHQRSLALLGGGGMAETICHSKVCKDFMDDHFEEVNMLLLLYFLKCEVYWVFVHVQYCNSVSVCTQVDKVLTKG